MLALSERLYIPRLALTVLFAAGVWFLPTARPLRADVQAGSYSMEAAIAPAQVAVNSSVTITISMANGFGSPQCTDGLTNGVDDDANTTVDDAGEARLGDLLNPLPAGCYQGIQWSIDFDETLVSVTAVAKLPAVPSWLTCAQNLGYETRVMVGCLDIAGPQTSYTGDFFTLTAFCIAPGTTVFTLPTTGTLRTRVFVDIADPPVHAHTDTVECVVDTDGDGTPDSSDVDDDNDGCSDVEELGPTPQLGGDRNPLDKWDFYDVNASKTVDLQDTLLILAHYGHGYNGGAYVDPTDNLLDRKAPNPAKKYQTAEENNGVDLADAILNQQSFGHTCTAPP